MVNPYKLFMPQCMLGKAGMGLNEPLIHFFRAGLFELKIKCNVPSCSGIACVPESSGHLIHFIRYVNDYIQIMADFKCQEVINENLVNELMFCLDLFINH